jgi:hypothetical protein
VKVAVVGGGTGVVIEAAADPGLTVAFTPSKVVHVFIISIDAIVFIIGHHCPNGTLNC